MVIKPKAISDTSRPFLKNRLRRQCATRKMLEKTGRALFDGNSYAFGKSVKHLFAFSKSSRIARNSFSWREIAGHRKQALIRENLFSASWRNIFNASSSLPKSE